VRAKPGQREARVPTRIAGTRRIVWTAVHRAIAAAAIAYVRRGDPRLTVYRRGSFARGDVVPGLSDVDLVMVGERGPSADPVATAERRWGRVTRALPGLGRRISIDLYEASELRKLSAGSMLTFGLPPGSDGHVVGPPLRFAAPPLRDPASLRSLPGLGQLGEDWTRVAGRERRPPAVQRDAQEVRLAAWLHLQRWWRPMFAATTKRSSAEAAHACFKAVAEVARILLAVRFDEHVMDRRTALDVLARRVPSDGPFLGRMAYLRDRLGRSSVPLAEILGWLLVQSGDLVRRFGDEVGEHGTTDVQLVLGDPEDLILDAADVEALADLRWRAGAGVTTAFPLADWRAVVLPAAPDHAAVHIAADPCDPAVLRRLTACAARGPYAVLRHGDLLILPAVAYERAVLRTVQFAGSDPVSFALLDGRDRAAFPEVRGWSIRDQARRAVAEHRGWLDVGQPGELPWARLGRLWSSARAALLLQSLREGEPQLALTVGGAAACLAARAPAAAAIAGHALEAYRRCRPVQGAPPARLLEEFERAVQALPVYARTPGGPTC
jgi:hypothetical protein